MTFENLSSSAYLFRSIRSHKEERGERMIWLSVGHPRILESSQGARHKDQPIIQEDEAESRSRGAIDVATHSTHRL